jgi:hypothetical protein
MKTYRHLRAIDRLAVALTWTRAGRGDYRHHAGTMAVRRCGRADSFRWAIIGGPRDGQLLASLRRALELAQESYLACRPRLTAGERRVRTSHEREPRARRSSRPAYVTGSRGRAAGPKAAAVRVTAAAGGRGYLFAELEPAGPVAAYVETVDDAGAVIGHRSGPLPLEAARRLAERRAHYLGLELEAAR